jgi:tetratricopeptide (TPR) repeat protein
MTAGSYYSTVMNDPEKSIGEYNRLLGVDPDDSWALNNSAILYTALGDEQEAHRRFRRAYEVETSTINGGNLVGILSDLERFDEARTLLADLDRRFPARLNVLFSRLLLDVNEGRFDSAEVTSRAIRVASRGGGVTARLTANFVEAGLAVIQGRVSDFIPVTESSIAMAEAAGMSGAALADEIDIVAVLEIHGSDPSIAATRMEAALRRIPLENIPPAERPYFNLILNAAFLRQSGRARSLICCGA